MKTKNKILILVSTALLAVSCMDQLDKDPIGLLTPEIVNTSPTLNSVQYSVTSSYQMLSNTLNLIGNWGWDDGVVTRNDFVLYDIGSDDALKKWAADGDQPWMDEVRNYSFIASNAAFNGIWSYLYEGVARSNIALSYLSDDNVIESIDMNDDLRKRLLGEAYFLRAFYYFDLVTNFGDVPMLTAPITNFEEAYEAAKRVEKESVWQLINDDLAKAYAALPQTKFSLAGEPWRVSLGAVVAMQAKVALYNENYTIVLEKVNELETLGFYSLNTNYFHSFSVANEYTDNEVIFSYNHQSKVTPNEGNGLCALLGWGFFAPSPNFIAEFENNDPRLAYTVDVDNKAIYKILGEIGLQNQGNDDAPSNKVYIRFADVILWKAEALIETDKVADGIKIINQVRERARKTVLADGTSTAPSGTLPDRSLSGLKEDAKKWLIHERRVELGLESHRLRDLKRWGIAKEVLNANGQSYKDKHSLFPIPQRDIDKSGGILTQNTGY